MSVKQIFNTSAELDYPTVLPTLDLDFANSKTLDPRITFTRASGGSYVGADGLIKSAAVNEPRFDHNPTTGESLGLLVEEARTNRHTYSEQFDNAAWGKNGATITSNATTAPDGTTTADKFASTSGAALIYVQQADYTLTNGASYTRTVFAKASEISILNIQVGNTTTGTVVVQANLSTGTATNGGVVTTLANGWFRISYSYTQSGTLGDFYLKLPANTVAGSGVFVWGAQIEAGSFPTSYIPTEGSSRTRAADTATITGTNFTSWYNQSQGTIFASVRTVTPASVANGFLQLTDGTPNNRIEIQQQNSGDAFPRIAGVYRYLNSTTGSFLNQETGWNTDGATVDNWAFGYDSSGFRLQTKFDATPSTGSGTFPQNLTNFLIGHGGTIGRLTYYPVRLPNAQLQVLTT